MIIRSKLGFIGPWNCEGGGSVSYCKSDFGRKADRHPEELQHGQWNCTMGTFLFHNQEQALLWLTNCTAKNRFKLMYWISVPFDNLSVDSEGNVFVGALPNYPLLAEGNAEPYTISSPATVFKISPEALQSKRQRGDGLPAREIVEDRNGKTRPTTTVIMHDAKTD
ncbi:hypothetical protein N7507_002878 [Penicillium longicatenatum]|nr:hypothetical protein N7507_002878 [Penicillium longicatenatum]